jgi:hypothetical protein
MSLWQRLRYTLVVPDDDGDSARKVPEETLSVAELEASIARADDKERAIGLTAAPVAALIAFLVAGSQISHATSLHQSTSTYETLLVVLAVMSVLMLVMSLLRKRLFLGIVMAMYGLGIFNLRYWGFGVPFIMAGAWYLVRAYRLQQRLKVATGEEQPPRGRTRANGSASGRPQANKRYTPKR